MVIHLRTLRRVNGVPMSVIDHYLPDLDWWPALQQFHSGSLHQFIEQHLQQPLTRRQTRISARARRPKRAGCWRSPPTRRCCACAPLTSAAAAKTWRNTPSAARADMIELTMEH